MIHTDFPTGNLRGEVVRTSRTVGDLQNYWASYDESLKDSVVYETQSWFPFPDGTEGVVCWASTKLYPGKVGDEHFMTRGHFHLKETHGELIIVVSGIGQLLLATRESERQVVDLTPGLTFYIEGKFFHRVINTGDKPLVFWCSWPADCGHDYSPFRI
jgi:glucose-6-phosphate isomerase